LVPGLDSLQSRDLPWREDLFEKASLCFREETNPTQGTKVHRCRVLFPSLFSQPLRHLVHHCRRSSESPSLFIVPTLWSHSFLYYTGSPYRRVGFPLELTQPTCQRISSIEKVSFFATDGTCDDTLLYFLNFNICAERFHTSRTVNGTAVPLLAQSRNVVWA
jgi:hypothetical protein